MASGLKRGWSCISCRQPAKTKTEIPRTNIPSFRVLPILAGHLRNRDGAQRFEESACLCFVVLVVAGKNNQEETILGYPRKLGNVEHRVIRHGKSVQREHAEYGRQHREQNRELEG